MQGGVAARPRSRRWRVAFALAIAAAGFLLGLVAGAILWSSPPAEGEMVWPVHVSVDFSSTPANASLQISLAIVKDNVTVGTADYVIGHPANDTLGPTFTTAQTLQAVPQTLQVVLALSQGGTWTFNIDVRPGSLYAAPVPYFLLDYTPPPAFPIGPASGWAVPLQLVG